MVVQEPGTPRELERHLRPQDVSTIFFDDLCAAIGGQRTAAGATDNPRILGVALNPQVVQPGDVFLAISGAKRHGAEFAATAAANGATAVITDQAGLGHLGEGFGLPVASVDNVRKIAAAAAQRVYGTAERSPQLLGVTGTNGKTTTTFMIRSILDALGVETGLVGTIEMSARGQIIPSVLTTPESTQLHGVLARMAEQQVQSVAMEVSSHSLSYGRVDALRFAVAGYTNLTQDHLDLHGSMQEYFETKAQLFTPAHSQRAVVLVDDDYGVQLAQRALVPTESLSLDEANDKADWRVIELEHFALGHSFTLLHRDGRSISARTALPGMFNVANAALAVLMVLASGVELDALQAALDANDPLSVAVPGRMQVVGHAPVAVVDFAHNSDAIAKALDSMRPGSDGRRIIVFGATGDRDKTKRPDMGAVAARHADIVIVTDDDPHSEDPAPIRAQVAAGAQQVIDSERPKVQLFNLAPRAKAVEFAVSLAAENDAILVAGRGHEVSQDVAGIDVELDDRVELANALNLHGFVTIH
ncbi:UDP-N-acetylmuramoyl-L-alanyl-D-glutamate--2,6-diaminopimelate ligase [Glutamicibacter uratoxydans]|uniref:UDP-N-acetylmuramyl-tripeptide synthetase n=1 Tax=Glutamicibacter uratoxydans TaxID=43667 RepID=A0A4Y4DP16_GLUUR|nr:UDP-N-acetylmuramoyl-L-alanyl-D-glutamate--2,6-diaminopimelate ligase [Glutamicibacter uratoxydans]GED07052.1 UDP-N-acetylmuramoyl-L-alanyl-D-glutamate--2,6-diaminopimelate ligase [Glutamicibacter uratoxydans]